jgi:hypothetical protein
LRVARRRRAEHYRACGALVRPRASRSTRTLDNKLQVFVGINVRLQNEDGVPIETHGDPHMLLSRFVLERDLSATKCLQFIDPYGDTTFNQDQVRVLIEEIGSFRESVDSATREYFDKILRVSGLAMAEPHLYVKFIGD